MKSDKEAESSMEWQKEIPYDTRQEAIADAIASFKGGLTKLKNKNIKHFKIGFRSKKKQTSQAFTVNKKTLDLEKCKSFLQDSKKEKVN